MSSHLLWFHFEILLSCLPLLFSSNVSLKNYCLQALRLHQLFCWAVRLHVNWGSCSLVIVLFSSSLWHTAPHCCPKRFCSLLFSLLFQTSITLMCFPHPYIGLFATVAVPNFPILQDCFFSKIWENMYTRYLYLRFPSLLLVFPILSVRMWHSFPAQWEDFSNKTHFSFWRPSKQVSTYCSDREWSD